MSINDDFSNKAEAEMKLNDLRMMEQAKIRKLADATIEERITFALKKTENDPERAFEYLRDNHLIKEGEMITIEDINNIVNKK